MFHMHGADLRQAPRSTFGPGRPAQMAELWARKYLSNLAACDQSLKAGTAATTRASLVDQLLSDLRSASVKAWNLTESLLAHEVKRHCIQATLVDPWQVSKDVYDIYGKALKAYANQLSPCRLSVNISADLGEIRQRYTSTDPRLIGFVSMQFHYSGQMLLKSVPRSEQALLSAYFKVVDDHLYMPLQRAYDAAAALDYGDERLGVVQTLLPHITTIAHSVVNRVNQLYPTYHCYTDCLNSRPVRISSIRDTEMFQVYLWTCVLEGRFNAIQEELFPLCVMLYPTLKVNWELVRQMLHLLAREFRHHTTAEQEQYYAPYQDALWHMFSPDLFPEVIEVA